MRPEAACAGTAAVLAHLEDLHHLGDVLVAAAGQVHQHGLPRHASAPPATIQASACAGSSAGMMPSVRASSWNASITSASVTAWYSARPIDGQVRVLGADARVVEAGRDRVGLQDLAVLVLHQVAAHAVHDARHAAPDRGAAGRLDADQLGVGVDEPGEDARSRSSRRRRRRPRRRDRRRSRSRHCSRASSPITRWNSRTIHGYGCGPITEPRQ